MAGHYASVLRAPTEVVMHNGRARIRSVIIALAVATLPTWAVAQTDLSDSSRWTTESRRPH